MSSRRGVARGVAFGALVTLVALLGVAACAKRSETKASAAQSFGCTMRSAADVAHITDGACSTPAKLVADKRLSGSVVDPWGHDYVIACDTGEVVVRSVGPDGKDKTADDLAFDGHTCNVLH